MKFCVKMAGASVLFVISLMTLQGSITSALELHSPCPDLFHYDSADHPNQWTGTVTLLSDSELHGVWLRLIFDKKLEELNAGGDFGEIIASENKKEYLIKNRNFVLKAGKPRLIEIIVKYEGDKIPLLTEYRLNAKMVCSSQESFGQLFSGDLNNKDFLASITSQSEPSAYKEFEGCGTAPLLANREPANEKAQDGQWPWQGAIYIQNNKGEKYICGATLISSKHVLTPAHCVTYQKSELAVPVRQLTVYLGKYSHNRDDEGKDIQKLGVERIFLHPGYRAEQLLNDLSIIQLNKPVIIGDYVRPICLRQFANKMEGLLVGYGINRDRMGDLTQTKVNVLEAEKCLEKNLNLKSILTDNVICANYAEDGTQCVGDSGSSLASLRGGNKPVWELNGLVTVGIALQDKHECNHASRILLLNVDNYLKWIQMILS
ncbi:prostasin-like isoform X2 [Zophobas morio]|uniref:prostasin-like isoform X2 n=1 Tax=Zophobas morio TaxID=2755281 RepID=UPI003082C941